MISTQLVVLLLTVAALAFFGGYQLGRQAGAHAAPSPTPRRGSQEPEHDFGPQPTGANPLPAPLSIEPSRPRGTPPPAAAGGNPPPRNQADAARGARPEPRRTGPPPPARAGLLDTGTESREGPKGPQAGDKMPGKSG